MKRPIPCRLPAAAPAAFTLIELMVALALSLLLLGAVIAMFGRVSEGVSESRSLLEMADRLRLTAQRLQMDLAGVTVTMNPPRDPANNEGYFEYIEGSASTASNCAVNSQNGGAVDQTVGDIDDVLMFTTRSSGRPFVGKYPLGPGGVAQSYVAEVAWFIRGHTLHRRVLLVLPGASLTGAPQAGYYASYDISAHWDSANGKMVPNTLADLTQRQYRFAHDATTPLNPCNWGQLGLPTLAECSSNWSVGRAPTQPTNKATIDFWSNHTSTSGGTDSYPWSDSTLLTGGTRTTDDIILTNVIGFDVKAWDPKANSGQGGYIDLGYGGGGAGTTVLSGNANGNSGLTRVYDTWSTTYFGTLWNDGLDLDSSGNSNGIVDDDLEKLHLPPYAVPLRGIQVKIRAFEPDSKQIREVTVVQDFLPQ